jgi:hypothetical protein
MQPSHTVSQYRSSKCERAKDDGLGACLTQQGNSVLPDAAIGCENDATGWSCRCDECACLSQAVAGSFIQALAFDAYRGTEQCYEAKPLDVWGKLVNGRLDLEHHACGYAQAVEQVESLRGIPILRVDADQRCAGLGELLDLSQQDGIGDHQMHMDGDAGGLFDSGDKIRKKEHRRRKVAVCNVKVQHVRVALDALQIGCQVDEVG